MGEDLHVARSLQEEASLVSEKISCENMFVVMKMGVRDR